MVRGEEDREPGMRVLYVCADAGISLDGTKGAAVHVRQTLGALEDRGVKITVLALRPGQPGTIPGQVLAPGDFRAHNRSKAAGTIAAEASAIASASDLTGRCPLSPGEVDLVYERYSLWSLTGAALAERLGVPLVLEVNAPLVEEQRRYRRLAMIEVAGAIERLLVRRADAILCVSSALRDRVVGLRGIDEGVHLFPNAVDTDLFRPAGNATGGAGRKAKETAVIFTGSFKPWHGVQDLVQAFAILLAQEPRSRLILVGDGPERSLVERRVLQLGVEPRVTFTGAVDHREVAALLSVADIAVAPYPPLDGFYFSPLKVEEYLASGLPVVATSCGDLDPHLRDGETALRVRPGDVPGLAKALIRLAGDPTLRRRIGQAGRKVAENHLSLRPTAERLVRLLEEVRGCRSAEWRRVAP